MKLVKLLAQASKIRRNRIKSGLDKAAKKPTEKRFKFWCFQKTNGDKKCLWSRKLSNGLYNA
jgi:hypothetical protein